MSILFVEKLPLRDRFMLGSAAPTESTDRIFGLHRPPEISGWVFCKDSALFLDAGQT
jgi:hypothetical protein